VKKPTIRIVGGKFKRTPIRVPNALQLRPTPNRVRETLFNWLNHLWYGDFTNKCVVDLFAGSGALGFEAASRGAHTVYMIESDPIALKALHSLRKRLAAENVKIIPGDAFRAIQRIPKSSIDLILLDPPFQNDWWDACWRAIIPLCQPGTLVYLEANHLPKLNPHFVQLRQSKAGQVHFMLLAFETHDKSSDNPCY